MKKIFAVLAAAAVAASTLAFAGCGKTAAEDVPQDTDSVYTPDTGVDDTAADENSTGETPVENNSDDNTPDDGIIPGNYREANALQVASALGRINANKLREFSGLGLKTGISASAAAGDIVSAEASVVLDYKIGLSDGIAGAGTATVKAVYSHRDYPENAVSIDLTGSVYNDLGFVYASAAGNVAGTVLTGDEKIKVNLQEILASLADNDSPASPSLDFGIGSFLNIANLIANSTEFGIKVYIDTDDGIKFKLSATEQTVWAAIESASGDVPTAELETIKDSVLFNCFKFDIYFAIDGNGTFSRASIVRDIDATVDLSAVKDLPAFTVNVKGFSTVYDFDGEVILPDSVTDGYYADITQTVLDLIEKYRESQWGV